MLLSAAIGNGECNDQDGKCCDSSNDKCTCISSAPSSQPSVSSGPSEVSSNKPSVSIEPSSQPSAIPSPTPSIQSSAIPSVSSAPSNNPSISYEPSLAEYPSTQPSFSSLPTETCVYMEPNPFTFGPPPPSADNNNIWPEDYQFWSSQVAKNSVPWTIKRDTPENYYLQSPNFNGALEGRQSNATLQVCSFFEGGDMTVNFQASVRETNGQVFQIVVDGAVATGGNIIVPTNKKNLVIPLSPGNHWVDFVYTWTPELDDLPITSDGIVKIFSVTLPPLNPSFPTSTPTDKPSYSPSASPSALPTSSPSASPSVSSIYVVNNAIDDLLKTFISWCT